MSAVEMNEFKSSNLADVCDNCGARHPEEKYCFKFWENEYSKQLDQTVTFKQENEKLRELVERALPIIMQYKYKSAIDKHETDILWSIDWQGKAKAILKTT